MRENGLKRIYRFLGKITSVKLLDISTKINPNHITISSFISVLFGILLVVFTNNPIYLVIGMQLALILDYADGEYARATLKTSKNGHYLDSMLDIFKIVLVYCFIYFINNSEIDRVLVFLNLAIFSIFLWSKIDIGKIKTSVNTDFKEGSYFKTNLLFGYSLVHHYLYISFYLLTAIDLFLILPIVFGSILIYKNYRNIFRVN
jgi:phosphatidylglycerophosphate synthase